MKYLLFIVFFISVAGTAQDWSGIRSSYPKAVQSSETITKLDGELKNVTFKNKPVLLAYKGAVLTLKAKFSKKKSDKKEFFKEGVSFIENALKTEPSNIEIRYIRMSVQENSPKFLGYHRNIEEDKEFILKNYASISSADLRKIVKDFVIESENFSENEKTNFFKT